MRHQAHITLVNGVETSALEIADRGLAYGDGVFETMRVVRNQVPLLDWHLARFKAGVLALRLGNPKALGLEFKRNLDVALKEVSGNALVKIIVTRGKGGRGYQADDRANPSIVVQVFDQPQYQRSYYDQGITAKLCDYRLPINPVLAGIKHLNRLDQVMAAHELEDEQEGIVCDSEGCVIEGTKSNLIIFESDAVVTPVLNKCGVRGALRAFLMEQTSALEFEIQEDNISTDRLYSAQGVALVNSVFGCWPVAKLDGLALPIDSRIKSIQNLLSQKLSYP